MVLPGSGYSILKTLISIRTYKGKFKVQPSVIPSICYKILLQCCIEQLLGGPERPRGAKDKVTAWVEWLKAALTLVFQKVCCVFSI